jgi:hypothetical protein
MIDSVRERARWESQGISLYKLEWISLYKLELEELSWRGVGVESS